MTDKEKKSKIADILMDFQEEYSNEVINRPMLASLYAGNILSFIDSLQEEPVSNDFEMALAEMIDKAQKCVVEPWVVAAQWKDELIKLAKSEEPVSEQNLSNVEKTVKEWKEPVSEDFTKALAECIHKAQCSVVDPLAHAEVWKEELVKLVKCEEPVSEELEEASKEWLRPQLDKSYVNYGEVKMMELTHFDGYAMLDAIEFGAQWQQEKDSIPTEYLEELINNLSKQFPEVSFAKLSRIVVRAAKWQKQQMMTKAIDAEVLENYDGKVIKYDEDALDEKLSNCNVFDKVKVVVIKED